MSVLQVRGRGLLDAIVIKDVEGVSAYDVCMKLKEAGLLVSAAVSCSPESSMAACKACAQTSSSCACTEKHDAYSLPTLLSGSVFVAGRPGSACVCSAQAARCMPC